MKSFFLASVLIFLSFNIRAQEIPPFAQIASVDFRGTGCDAESARISMTSDLSYLSVLYDRFSASIGVGSENPTAKQAIKNCAIVVKLVIPSGWSFQFESVEYNGFVSLPTADFQAVQRISAFSFDGMRGRDFQQNVLKGPLTDNFRSVYVNQTQKNIGPQSEKIIPFGMGNMIGRGWGIGRGNGEGMGPRQPPIGRPPFQPPGQGWGRRFKQRKGDLMDCQDRDQQAALILRSAIIVRQLNPRSPNNQLASISVDSTDASVQKLKINWNKCQTE